MDTVELNVKDIDNLFANSDHQADVLIGLYKLVYPNWDNIQHINGYPTVNEFTSKYLFYKFIQFDKDHHPNVVAGGCWMNSGFSSSNKESLIDFEVLPCEVTLK